MIKYILIFCFVYIQSFGQIKNISGIAYYKKSLVIKAEKPEIKPFDAALIDAYNKIHFVLDFNNHESAFQFSKEVKKELNSLYNIATIIGGGKGIYYANNIDNIYLQQREGFGKRYIIERTINKFEWDLFNETKIIEGYTCYRAKTLKKLYVSKNEFTSRVVEAWYSKELSIPHGPLGYGNLPGLILELREGKFIYTLQKIIFDSSVRISKPDEGEVISEIAFEMLAEKAIENRKN